MFTHMKKLLFAMTVAVGVVGVAPAHAADCTGMAGYYLDNGACVECGLGTHYCPGDNTRQPCPDIETHHNTAWPDNYYNPTIDIDRSRIYTESNNSKYINYPDAGRCFLYHYLKNDYGDLYDIRNYNTTTGRYDGTTDGYKWNYMSANPGHYLTQPGACGYYAYYRGAAVCPAGGYCPGKARVVCDSSNQATVHTETFGLEVCPENTYSDAGATKCTPCPTGWGNTGDSPADHAGAASCNKCAAGYYMENGTCKICDIGYYCPGDNARHVCNTDYSKPYYADEQGLSACKECPKLPQNIAATADVSYWYHESNSTIHTSVVYCRARWPLVQTHGVLSIDCNHGNAGYHESAGSYCQLIKPLQSCDAGYYIDIENKALVSLYDANNLYTYDYPTVAGQQYCTPVPVGYWSPDGTWAATACPDGTSTRTDTATSADACVSLCTNGGKKLHAGNHEFNIWPDGTCSSPSIGIGLPGGTCCVNLESGAGTGINVKWDGNIYHTVN